MKLYTFLNDDGTVQQEVRAEDYYQAIKKSGGWSVPTATTEQDYYSTEVSND